MEVIFKPTHACNGNCIYCAASSFHGNTSVFPAERLAGVFQRFCDWLVEEPARTVRFVWHGGEPLLCGPDYFRRIIDEQRRIFGADMSRVKNTIQSNITLINKDWMHVLKDLVHEQTVGTSFDIVPGIRGLKSGNGLATKWLRALELLRQNDIPVGVVYTVHKKSLERARDIYWFFKNLDPSLSLRLNPMYKQGSAREKEIEPLHITPEQYGAFLLEVMQIWQSDLMTARVAPMYEWYRAWMGDGHALCCDSRGACHLSHLAVNPDGTVYGCGRLSDEGLEPLGNVLEQPIDEFLAHRFRAKMAERGQVLQESDCKDCPYWNLCHGGCPLIAWLYYGDTHRATYFCAARKMVFEQFATKFGDAAGLAPMPQRKQDA